MADDGSTVPTDGSTILISIGGTELESVTSTMSTLERDSNHQQKQGRNASTDIALHHPLHLEVLADKLVQHLTNADASKLLSLLLERLTKSNNA